MVKEPKNGDSVVAKVDRVEDYGVYFDYSGRTILVLIPELSWGSDLDPKEEFRPGETFEVIVLRYVLEKQSFMGSIRRAIVENNPYMDLVNSPPGATFRARIREIFGGIATLEILDFGILATMSLDQLPGGVKTGTVVETRRSSVDPEKGEAKLDFVRLF